MEAGINPTWTEVQETVFKIYLESSNCFALRELIMTMRDLLKYDQRTKQGKRAVAQGRLRIAMATDDELMELAYLQEKVIGNHSFQAIAQAYERFKLLRDTIRKKGITKKEIIAREVVNRDV